jgi:hypothetical protein
MNHPNLSTTLLRMLGGALAIVVCGDALLQALAHLRDLSQINHIAGVWLTLAQALRAGVLYPPLEQDGHYAGTRYMPLFFALVALLAKLTGDYLLAAKLAGLLSMVGLVAAVFVAARRVTGHALDAFIFAALVLVFPEGRRVLLWPHADALAVALSVGGLLLASGERAGAGTLAGAALLFALAVGAKFSSVAGVAAACACLGARDWRRAAGLAGMTAVLGVGGFALLQLGSDGRFLDNFRAVGSGGMSTESLRIGPTRLFQAAGVSTRIAFVLPLVLPPAAFVLVQDALRRRVSLWDWYFLFALPVTLFIFTSPGTDSNHLLELEVAAVLVLAGWLRRPAEEVPAWTEAAARGFAAAALLFGLVYAAECRRYEPTRDAIPPQALTEALPADGELLTEDATPAVLLGRRPVVMDPFAFRLLAERGRIDPAPLAERVRRREFAALVLVRRIDDPKQSLAPQFHFGPEVTDAIRESYGFERQVGGYYLYKPWPERPERQAD